MRGLGCLAEGEKPTAAAAKTAMTSRARRLLLSILERSCERALALDAAGRISITVAPRLRRGRERLEIIESEEIDWPALLADLARDHDAGTRTRALWRDPLAPLLRRYRLEAGSWVWDAERAVELLESWRRSGRSPGRSRLCLAPLDGCEGAVEELTLDADLAIRRLNDTDREDLWRRHGAELHPGPINPRIADLEAWEFAVEHRWKSEAPGPADDTRAVGVIRDVVRALRLHHPGVIGARLLWIGADPDDRWAEEDRGALLTRIGIDADRRGDRPAARLDPLSGADLQQLLSALRMSRGAHLGLILDRFDSAYSKPSPQDRLIDLWIALEALILPDGGDEPRHRAALRLAHLLGADPDGRRAVFELAMRSHDQRSRALRGPGGSVELDGLVEATRNLAREALRARLLDPPKEGVLGLDRMLFQRDR
jgi:hypothetical protein